MKDKGGTTFDTQTAKGKWDLGGSFEALERWRSFAENQR